MSNSYYEASGVPATRSAGSSSPMRAEFNDIELGFDKMPVLTGNANKPVVINAGATALTTVAQLGIGQGGTGSSGIAAGNIVFGGPGGLLYSGNNTFFWDDTAKALGIGTNAPTGYRIRILGNTGGGTTPTAVAMQGTIAAATITSANTFLSSPTFDAAVHTIAAYAHFNASVVGGSSGGATITSHIGFSAGSSLSGVTATNVYGFYSTINASTGRWGFYSQGTANNAFQGSTRFGGVTAPVYAVDVTGEVSATGTIQTTGGVMHVDRLLDAQPADFYMTADAGQNVNVIMRGPSAGVGVNRWVIRKNATAEVPPTNVGSDFEINAYSDAGGLLGTALSIARSTRIVTIGNATITTATITTATITTGTITNPTFTNAPTLTGYTTGVVLHVGASGVIAQDGNFSYDPATNRLGIGSGIASAATATVTLQLQTSTNAMHDAAVFSSGGTPIAGSGARLYLTSVSTTGRGAYIEGVNTSGASNAHDMVLGTNAGSATPVERMRITSAGDVYFKDSTTFAFSASTETIALGLVAAQNVAVRVAKNINHVGGNSYGMLMDGTIQTGSTVASNFIMTNPQVAAAAPVGILRHFYASAQTTFGSVVTAQHGFWAESTLTGATSNYGFYGNIAAATNRWNFYALGTANNAFSGNTRFGGVTAPSAVVDITDAIGVAPAGSFNSGMRVATTYSGDPGGTSFVTAVQLDSVITGANTVAMHRGLTVVTTNQHTGLITTSTAAYFHNSINGSGDVTNMSVISALLVANSSSTAAAVVPLGTVIDIDAPALAGAGVYTNITAINIGNQAVSVARTPGFICGVDVANFTAVAGGTHASFRSLMTAGTNRWGFWQQSGANNAFAGFTSFGTNNPPVAAVDVVGNVALTGDLGLGAASVIGWTTRSNISTPGNGLLHLYNNAFTAGVRLDFSTEGALLISSTTGSTGALTVVGIASTVTAGECRAIGGFWSRQQTALAAGATAQYFIKGSSATSIGLWFGSGVPGAAVSAQAGSLYLRTDGAANTRLYINTSAGTGTTWSAVTTP